MKTVEQKVLKYVELAKACKYKPPNKLNIQDWTEEDIIFASTHQIIHNELFILAQIVYIKKFPSILYPYYKSTMRSYIKTFS